ncbi:serine protease snake [Papilio machaon]|uniref:serine protease snake n=1 Tax=Papilio machaon TaxID=76193 RepID=UPI001E66484D|nr:serine protease snake [Papilio machaon]
MDMRRGLPPQICSYLGMDTVVCCVESFTPITSTRPYTLTTIRTIKKPTPVIPTYDYVINDRFANNEATCEPIDPSLTSPKTGQKAWDKCIEYQEKLVYPCKKTNTLSADINGVGQARVSNCNHDADQLIVGGMNASSGEFPHMALLGYEQGKDILWSCGGSVISERYILTAGHCTYSVGVGRVKYALVGILSRSEITEGSQRYDLEMSIRHPDYKPPSKYHDIALLKTKTEIVLSSRVVPACLHVDMSADDARALASGWGFTKYRGTTSDVLQKVILEKFSDEECLKKYPGNRYLRNGFDPTTQICYGDHDESKDTCQGDSGGPLQLKSKKLKCMYVLVGVTSFGSGCGFIGQPGVYTKVISYLSWIEAIVWPN